MNDLVVESEGFVNEELDGPIIPAEVREQLKLLKNIGKQVGPMG